MNIIEIFDESLHWMTIRLTSQDVSYNKLQAFAKLVGATKWVIGHELSHKNVEHSHLVLAVPVDFSDYDWKKYIRETFCLKGNSGFTKSRVRTTQYRAIQYVLKDGKYRSKGMDKDKLKKMYVQSTKKFNKIEFKEALTVIENNYYQKGGFSNFARAYYRLRISYGQKPNYNSISNYLLFHYHKKSPEQGDRYIDTIADSIQFELVYSTQNRPSHDR